MGWILPGDGRRIERSAAQHLTGRASGRRPREGTGNFGVSLGRPGHAGPAPGKAGGGRVHGAGPHGSPRVLDQHWRES